MSCYVTLDQIKELGSMPSEDIAELETRYSGISLRVATKVSGDIDMRLIKRYAIPLTSPYPDAIISLCARMTAWRLWLKRGFNPSGEIDALLESDNKAAQEMLKEIADGNIGLAEIPSYQGATGSGVSRGGPLGYSEASQHTWIYRQAADTQNDDPNGV